MDFSKYQAEMELYGMSTLIYYAKLKVSDFCITGVILFILSLAFTFFPARRAAKLDPVRAIRHL
jgi:ABC-type lipoprotein release transport system permease subunit